jgi:hypothetical protein
MIMEKWPLANVMIMTAVRASATVIMRSGALWRQQSHDHKAKTAIGSGNGSIVRFDGR